MTLLKYNNKVYELIKGDAGVGDLIYLDKHYEFDRGIYEVKGLANGFSGDVYVDDTFDSVDYADYFLLKEAD